MKKTLSLITVLVIISSALALGSLRHFSAAESPDPMSFFDFTGYDASTNRPGIYDPSTLAGTPGDPYNIRLSDQKSTAETAEQLALFFLGFTGSIALLIIVIGGIMYITAHGGEQAETAKKLIIQAIIGMFVVICAYTIVATAVSLGFLSSSPFL